MRLEGPVRTSTPWRRFPLLTPGIVVVALGDKTRDPDPRWMGPSAPRIEEAASDDPGEESPSGILVKIGGKWLIF